MLALGAVAGLLAFSIIVSFQELEARYSVVVFLALAGLLIAPLIGNVRLVCLYAILLLAVVKLRVSFLNVPHMGGAGGIFLDAVDPFLLLLLYFQVRDRVRGYRADYRYPRPLLFWTGMIALGVLSFVMGPLRTLSLLEVFRMAKLLLLALLIVNEVRRIGQFRHAIIAITLGVIVQSAIALGEYMVGGTLGLEVLGEASEVDVKNLSAATLTTGDFVNRVGALLGHANLLAGYLALFLPMAVALVLAPVSGRLKIPLVIALLLGQPALVLTLSRAGWIDFIVAFAMVLSLGALHAGSRRKYLVARVAIVVATVAVALALSPHIVKRLLETDPSAVEMRLEWLQTARAMIVANPVLGVGLNSYVYAQVPYGKDKTAEDMSERYGDVNVWPAVHNSWVLAWTEQGTVGFLLWVCFHFFVIAEAVRNLRIRDPMMHALNVGLLAGFVAIMIDGLASFYVRTEAPARMFWIATGLILAIGYWRREGEPAALAVAELPEVPEPRKEGAPAGGGRWLPGRESALR